MEPVTTPILSATVGGCRGGGEAGAKAVILYGEDRLAWAAELDWIEAAVVVWLDGSVYATRHRGGGVSVERLVVRGSGLAALAFLTAATIWGLLVSSKLLGRLVKAKPLTWFQESLGVGALIATVVHVVVLSIHHRE